MAYAETTSVPFERSISEIITTIKGHGAAQIGQFEGEDFFAVQFSIADRLIRFRLPLSALSEVPTHDGRRRTLDRNQRLTRLDQLRRSRGRALLLVIKAKLESVESGIETIEQAFLANVVMADGATVWERVSGPIALEYKEGAPNQALGFLPAPGGAGA